MWEEYGIFTAIMKLAHQLKWIWFGCWSIKQAFVGETGFWLSLQTFIHIVRGKNAVFLQFFSVMFTRSDKARTSVAQFGPQLHFFLSFLTKCLVPCRGNDSGQSISKECQSWMWAICWKVVLIKVSQWPLNAIITRARLRVPEMVWMGSKVWNFTGSRSRPESFRLSNIWYFMTHNLHKAPRGHSLELVLGAGRRSCCTIRLDSELMGLPHHPGPVPHLPTYTVSVWKRPPKGLVPFSTYELIMED